MTLHLNGMRLCELRSGLPNATRSHGSALLFMSLKLRMPSPKHFRVLFGYFRMMSS